MSENAHEARLSRIRAIEGLTVEQQCQDCGGEFQAVDYDDGKRWEHCEDCGRDREVTSP